MEKTPKRILVKTVLFALILLLVPLWWLFGKKETFSVRERRYLAAFPVPSFTDMNAWSWDDAFETYLSDHFPFRDTLTGFFSYVRRFTGTQYQADIYAAKTGALVEERLKSDPASLALLKRQCARLQKLAETTGKPLVLLVPPSAGYIRRDDLPAPLGALFADEELLACLSGYEGLDCIDLTGAFAGHGDYFYRTDNHWNVRGAETAAALFLRHAGIEEKADACTHETFEGFRGSTYSRSAFWLTDPEPITISVPNASYTVRFEEAGETRTDLYYRDAMDSYDPYNIFFDGNHGIVRIENTDPAQTRSLLVIKDSFANAVVPCLIPYYKTVLMIDPRYYRGNVAELVSAERIDTLACFCSLRSLSSGVFYA